MRIAFLAILLSLSACAGDSETAGDGSERDHRGSSDNGGSGSAAFSLTGTVSNPFTNAQTGRLVAGVVPRSLFVPPIKCSNFAVKDDRTGATLPTSYSLQDLVAGEYVLAALLIDGTTTEAPFAAYGVTVERDGVHYNSPTVTSTIDLVIQGTVTYDCP